MSAISGALANQYQDNLIAAGAIFIFGAFFLASPYLLYRQTQVNCYEEFQLTPPPFRKQSEDRCNLNKWIAVSLYGILSLVLLGVIVYGIYFEISEKLPNVKAFIGHFKRKD